MHRIDPRPLPGHGNGQRYPGLLYPGLCHPLPAGPGVFTGVFKGLLAPRRGGCLRPVRSLGPLLMVLAVLALAGCETLREIDPTRQGESRAPQQTTPRPEPVQPEAARRDGVIPAPSPSAPRAAPFEPGPFPQDPSAPGAAEAGPEAAEIHLIPPPGMAAKTPVAFLVPLSGPGAALGRGFLNAAQMALFEVADERLALLPFDTEGTAQGAEDAARRALDAGAQLILGPLFGASVEAVRPLAAAKGVPVIAFSNDRAVVGPGVQLFGITPENQVDRVVGYAASRGVLRLAAILPEGPFGDRMAQGLVEASHRYGATVTSVLRYGEATTETIAPLVRRLTRYEQRRAAWRAERARLEALDDEASRRALARLSLTESLGDIEFDGVLLPQGGQDLRVIAPLFAFYDVDMRRLRLLGSVQWDDLDLATEPALRGGWFPAPDPEARGAFISAYQSHYGEAPPRIASLAYDATALAAILLRQSMSATAMAGADAPGSPFALSALTAPSGFAGVDGIFRLLPDGQIERGLAVKEVGDRRFRLLSPAPSSFERVGF